MEYKDFYDKVAQLLEDWVNGDDPVNVLEKIFVVGVEFEAAQQMRAADWLDGHDENCSLRRGGPACTCVRAQPAIR